MESLKSKTITLRGNLGVLTTEEAIKLATDAGAEVRDCDKSNSVDYLVVGEGAVEPEDGLFAKKLDVDSFVAMCDASKLESLNSLRTQLQSTRNKTMTVTKTIRTLGDTLITLSKSLGKLEELMSRLPEPLCNP
eukprot:TRINITY_DN3419_c2_g1_i1.p1 TRINITY_DN3419_c2_g1~~TRINITY_DN3419_c2_g1_i1.p1  ORF type:complete len:134 (+),score=19.28 TRINITY_DN3419_c2_g1_i1:52-453(+)